MTWLQGVRIECNSFALTRGFLLMLSDSSVSSEDYSAEPLFDEEF